METNIFLDTYKLIVITYRINNLVKVSLLNPNLPKNDSSPVTQSKYRKHLVVLPLFNSLFSKN